MSGTRLLLVEDDPDLLEILHLTFQKEGFETLEARDGREAVEIAQREVPDLIVLDVTLPVLDGIEVCRQLRADERLRNVPVLMLTARGEETDVVLGLSIGADDYVVKPARPRELAARVRALLRRHRAALDDSSDAAVLSRGGIVIDPSRFEVRAGGESVRLTPTEFRILQTLAGRPGRVFRRAELVEYGIGPAAFVEDRTVDTHIKTLRSKLGDAANVIETVRGIGYRFRDAESR